MSAAESTVTHAISTRRNFAEAFTGAMMARYEPGPRATDTVLRFGLRRHRYAADLSERCRLTRC